MSASLPPNDSRGSSLIAVQWTTVSVASLLVFLRVYTKAFLRKTAGADDWTMVIALGFAAAQSILTIFLVDNGFGRHIEYLQPDQIGNFLLLTTITELLHTIGTLLVRVSVCLFVLRLVPPTHREFYKYTYALITFFAVISVATLLLILLGCIPIQGSWCKDIRARCIPRGDLNIIAKTQGGFSAFMDILCVGLPIFFLRNLQAKLGQKISLFVLLGLGLFTAACAILRTSNISFTNKDYTWGKAPVVFWACLEQNIGIIAASAPAVRQLYSFVLEKYFPSFSDNHPHIRPLKLHTASSYTGASNASHSDRVWLGGRGSRSMRMASSADAAGGGGGGTILPGPPSPTKKEPRLDYDSPTLDVSPKLEQAVTRGEIFSYIGS